MDHKAKRLFFVKLGAAAGIAVLIMAMAKAVAHSPDVSLSADEIARMLGGKVCSTKAGAKFAFGQDGQYSYEGLWKNNGRYTVSAGTITVELDNGLERSFIISRKGGAFFIERTALSCDRMTSSRPE